MSTATEHYERAISHWAAQRHEAAVAELKTALDLRTDFQQARLNLGLIYAVMNRYDEALQEFQTLIQAGPNDAITYHCVGKMFAQKAKATQSRDDWSSARDAYRQSLTLAPDNADALNGIAVVSFELGDFGEAAAFSRQAARLAPEDRKIVYNESAIGGQILRHYISRGQWKEAWRFWQATWLLWRSEVRARGSKPRS